MANFAAYTGLRWGELAALTVAQITPAARTVDVDRKIIEIGGKLFAEPPKGRKRRRTIYPSRTPDGYALADQVAARALAARAEQETGTNPGGLMIPSPRGTHWRSSNFARRVLASSEAVILAIFGAVLGIVIGTLMGLALVASLRQEGITETSVPYSTLAIFLVVAAVLGLIAADWPARRAAKLDVLAAIATE